MIASVTTQTINRRPRWLRFSLRTLLIFVTLLCIVLGIWLERARRQHEIVKAIRDAGGYVEYEIQDAKAARDEMESFWHGNPFGRDLLNCVQSATITDRRLLPRVVQLTGLIQLTVEDSDLADEDLGDLKLVRRLKAVCLVGDYNFARVQGNPGIWRWHVSTFHSRNLLSDKSLEFLSHVQTLEMIEINGESFTADGLKKLLPLRKLSDVYIDCANAEASVPQKFWLEPLRQLPALNSVMIHSPSGSVYSDGSRPWAIKYMSDYWAEY